MGNTVNNSSSGVLAAMLLLLGLGLLVFGVVWIFLQRRAAEQPEEEGEPAKDSAPALPQEALEDERCRRMEEIIQAQKYQIEDMEQQLSDAARLRHDFRQELLALQEFARSGDRDSLDRYLPQVRLEGRTGSVPLCPNPLVNTILRFYFNKARAAGIEIDAAVQADETLWLSVGDAGVLLGNLLENAVTAAAEAPAGERRLRLRITQTQDCFVIAMGNTFGAPRTREESGAFTSTKPDHTGIGLGSIRTVALQYDGEAKFLIDGELFMSYVILLRPDTPKSSAKGSNRP